MVCLIGHILPLTFRTWLRRSIVGLGLFFAMSLFCLGQPVRELKTFAASPSSSPASWSVSHTNRLQSVIQGQIPLSPGVPLAQDIKGGASQSFKLWVPPGQYLRVLIKQYNIILEAALFDSHGNQVVQMDNPGGGTGPIYISTIAEGSGEYRLEVRSTEPWANAGRFEAVIDEQRGATIEDKDHVAAQQAFAEARRLAEQETNESRQAALKKYKEALTYWERVENTHWRVLTLYSIGSTYRRLGEMGDASEWFVKSLDKQLITKLGRDDWRLIASALNNRGLTAADLGDDTGAFESLNKALRLYQDHGDKRGEASAFNNIGYTFHKLGRFREAAENFEKSLPLRRTENDQLREFNVVNNLGTIYDALGEPHKALEACRKTLQVWRDLYKQGQLSDPDRLAAALNNTAAAYDRLGEWQEALNSYEEALSILQKSGNAQRQAATLDNIGELHFVLGDSDRALEYYNEALGLIREKVKDQKAEANVLTHIGQVYVSEGKLTQALASFNTARELPQRPQRKAELMANIGVAYSIQHNPAEAFKLYNEALELFRSNDDLRGEAATLLKMSEVQGQEGKDSLALENLSQALSLWRTVKDRRGEALTLQAIAQVKASQNNLEDALKLSVKAIEIVESLRTKVSSRQLRTSYFSTQENFYELFIHLNMRLYERDQSSESLAAALQGSERSRARSLIDTLVEARTDITEGANDELLRLDRDLQRKVRAKLEAQTALLGSKHNEGDAGAFSKEVSDLIRQQDELRDRIRTSNPKYSHLTQPQLLTLTEIQQQLDADTLLLEYSLGEKRSYVWVVSRDSIDGLELAARDRIESTARRVTEAMSAQNHEVKGESFAQKSIRLDKAERDSLEAAAALTKLILDPVASLLGQKRLVVVADGALQMVPFAALPAPKGTAAIDKATRSANPARTVTPEAARELARATAVHLLAEHEIVTLPSASVLALQRRDLANRQPAPLAVAVIADPVFDSEDVRVAKSKRNRNQVRKTGVTDEQAGTVLSKPGSPTHSAAPSKPVAESSAPSSLSARESDLATALRDVGVEPDGKLRRLSYSLREANAIATVVQPEQFFRALNFKASRATVTGLELPKYRYIHFATHGFLDLEHPELSGIVLSMVDEKGQPQDGYLRLHDIYNLNLPAELVVLSACQTGIGKQIRGEGLIALTRGFMYAGAKSVVASLWKVDDAATAALMAEFYKQMFTNKLKPAAALRAAQIQISKQKLWQSPYYWAGFFIQGEWN